MVARQDCLVAAIAIDVEAFDLFPLEEPGDAIV